MVTNSDTLGKGFTVLDLPYLNQIKVNFYIFDPSVMRVGFHEVGNGVQVGCDNFLHLLVLAELSKKLSNSVSVI